MEQEIPSTFEQNFQYTYKNSSEGAKNLNWYAARKSWPYQQSYLQNSILLEKESEGWGKN